MSDALPFRRRTLATVIAAACGVAPVGQAAVRAGQVDYAVGNVVATASDGQRRQLAKGAAIRVGDTIETNTGRAWLRFTDGGYMSLQPGSEFRVDDYRFKDEEEEDRSFFSLLKGGVRAITGLVGHTRRESYRLKTPVATIGIRGTEYLAQLGNSLTLSCGVGICVATNEAGEIVLYAGQTVYIKDQSSPGERLTRKVVLPPSPPVSFLGDEIRNDDGSLAVIGEPPSPPEPPEFIYSEDVPLMEGEQSGLYLALSYGGEDSSYAIEHDARVETGTAPEYVTGTFDPDLVLEQAGWNRDPDTDEFTEHVTFTDMYSYTSAADVDTDGVIAWGRWTGGTVDGTVFEDGMLYTYGSNHSVHYVAGVPTPESDLLNLKATGAAAVYNLIGATTPTFGDDGFEGSSDFGDIVSVSGALAADFAASTVRTSLVLDFTNNDLNIDSGPMPIAGGDGGRFGGSGAWATSPLDVSASYSTKIQGFFVGGAASRAGYAYDVYVNGRYDDYPVNGAVAFQKGGQANTISFPAPE